MGLSSGRKLHLDVCFQTEILYIKPIFYTMITILKNIFVFLTAISSVTSLECYVCHEQDGNEGKCAHTIKTCEHHEDRCFSEIIWSTTPYWSQGAEKQYYVSKKCATQNYCDTQIRGNMPLCHYLWYEDWKCAECCQGDRCNYYVTLGASNQNANQILLFCSTIALYFVSHVFRIN